VAKDNLHNMFNVSSDDFFNRLFGKPAELPTAKLSALLSLYAAPPVATTLTQLMALAPPPQAEGYLSRMFSVFRLPAPQPPAPTGLWFKDRYFSEPSAFSSTFIPKLSGLYAIVAFDLAGSPRPFRVIYFGKASDLSDRVVRSHEKYDTWCQAAGSSGRLLISYHLMPNAHDLELYSAEDVLIKHYQPVCNMKSNPSFGF
jgi:hypothetical protein